MVVLKEFISVLSDIRKDKFSYLFLFIQFVYFSGLVRQFGTDEFLVGNLFFTLSLCLFKKRISDRDFRILVIVFLVFILINIIPFILWGADLRLFLGFSGRIFLGILIVIFFKHNFFDFFEKLVFVLAFISIPLFILQLINVEIFKVFQPISDVVLGESRLRLSGRDGVNTSHQYFFIFLVNQWALLRNSGFMWEPAAYSAILTWAMVINSFKYKFSINPRLIIYIIAIISTFSIGAYTYMIVFYGLILSYNFKPIRVFPFILLIIGMAFLFYQFDFTRDNVEMIDKKIQTEQARAEQIRHGNIPEKVSRVGGVYANIQHIINEPFGYGVYYSFDLDEGFIARSPNGLMILLMNWGVGAFIIILISAYKLIYKLQGIYLVKISPIQTFFLIILIILPLAGNPFYNQPLLFSIIFSGFVVRIPVNTMK